MANENDITITLSLVNKIQGDLEKARQQIAGFTGQAGTGYQKFSNTVQSNNTKMMGSIKQLVGAFGLAFGAIQIARFTKDIINLGLETEKISKMFQNIASAKGFSASGILNELNKGFAGQVSKLEMQKIALKTLSTNIRLTEGDFAKLSQAARILGDSVGKEAGEAFNILITSLGRLSPKMLSQIGIYMSTKEASDLFTKGMSKSEKQAVLLEEIMSRMGKRVAEFGGDIDTAQDSAQELSTAFENLNEAVGAFVVSEGFKEFIKLLTVGVKGATGILGGASEIFGKPGNAERAQEQLGTEIQLTKEMIDEVENLGKVKFKWNNVEMIQRLGIIKMAKTYRPEEDELSRLKGYLKDSEKLYEDNEKEISTKRSKIRKDQLDKDKVTELQKQIDADNKLADKLSKTARSKIDFTKQEQLKIENDEYNKQIEIANKLNIEESKRKQIIEDINRAHQDTLKSILDIKSAEEDINKAIEEIKLKSPKRMLGEERATRTLGGFSPTLEGMMSQRQLESGQVTGYAYNKDLQSRFAQAQSGILPQTQIKPLESSKTITKGGAETDDKGVKEATTSVKNQAKAVKELCKAIITENKMQITALALANKDLVQVAANEELVVQSLDKVAKWLWNHEARITALEFK